MAATFSKARRAREPGTWALVAAGIVAAAVLAVPFGGLGPGRVAPEDAGGSGRELPSVAPGGDAGAPADGYAWVVARRSSGEGNAEAIEARIDAAPDAGACAGTRTWTEGDAAAVATPFRGPVAPAGFVPRGPLDVAPGDEVFLPDWDFREPCEGVPDVHPAVVRGREAVRVVVNGAPVLVDAWVATSPESGEFPTGTGTFAWDAATGVLLAAEFEGHSGRTATRLVAADAPLSKA